MNEVFADVTQYESFGNDDVTLTLMLRKAAGVSYTITSIPHIEIVFSNVNASARLMLSYTTEYNISITATVQGQCSKSKIITLKYGEYDFFCLHEHNNKLNILKST